MLAASANSILTVAISRGSAATVVCWTFNLATVSIAWNCFGKLAFTATLLRISVRRGYRWLLYFFIVQLICVETAHIVFRYLQYRPVQLLWNNAPQPGWCWKPSAVQVFDVGFGSYDSTTDLTLSLLPFCLVSQLDLSKPVKIAMMGLLQLGLFATACSVLKILTEQEVLGQAPWARGPTAIVIWSTTENTTILIAATFPVLKPLADTIKSTLEHSRHSRNGFEIANSSAPSGQPSQSQGSRCVRWFRRSEPAPATRLHDLPLPVIPPPTAHSQLNAVALWRRATRVFHDSTSSTSSDFFGGRTVPSLSQDVVEQAPQIGHLPHLGPALPSSFLKDPSPDTLSSPPPTKT